MRERAIDELWQTQFVDTQVRKTVNDMLQGDEAFVKFLASRLLGLQEADIRASLKRAVQRVEYPTLNDQQVPAEPEAVIVRSDEVPVAAPPSPPSILSMQSDVPTYGGAAQNSGRRRFQSMADLLILGRIKVGDTLTIKGRPNSAAIIVDGKHVMFKGEQLSFNEWGCRVTGWTAIQIYKWALIPDGRLLDQLRDIPPAVAQYNGSGGA